jgi:glutamate racemase
MPAHKTASRTARTRYARLPLVAAPRLVPAAGYRATLRSILVGPSVTPRIMRSPNILVFDSGVGGLTVFREIVHARPDGRYVYVGDDALFPYGKIPEAKLIARVTSLMGELIETHSPDLVVIACSTASVQALSALRARFAIPFVGTVPAIKPACAASQSKRISVLGTEATVAREYTHALIRSFARGCDVTLVGSANLPTLAEAALAGAAIDDDAIRAEIEPCFVADGSERTDTIVLACTHFPLLLAHFERLAPWPVRWIDPAPAIARRVVELVGPATGRPTQGLAQAIFTSGRAPSAELAATLGQFGLSAGEFAPPGAFDTPAVSA